MVAGGEPAPVGSPPPAEPRRPPVQAAAIAAMIFVVAGGIYVAGSMQSNGPLGPAVLALVVAALCLAAAIAMLTTVTAFAWDTFSLIVRWALLAYVVIAGMLEYVFALDGTPARVMVLLTCMLLIFAVDIPMLLAFSVARYQEVRE